MANYDVRIIFRTTEENRSMLQSLADVAGHNNISRTVRELIDETCDQARMFAAQRRRHRGQKGGGR